MAPRTTNSLMKETLLPIAIVSLVLAATGYFLGSTLVEQPTRNERGEDGETKGSAVGEEKPAATEHHQTTPGASNHEQANPALKLKSLPPIVTNLAAPDHAWIRMQCSIVYDAKALPEPEIMAAQINADVVAFLRTQTLAAIEGAAGLRRLQEDLDERVLTRSNGAVHELIIETLVVQ